MRSWAITIHKAQGMTLSFARVAAQNVWDPGHLYVALSRLRGIEGLSLASGITSDMIKRNERVAEFYDWCNKRQRFNSVT
jgi:ATP-dependent exoDNAse (exonuclease V) alpha subunit